jgi:phosphate transporter
MFSPTVMLLIGGFTIAAVLSKTRLDVMTASRILNAAGTKPSVVLLVLMCVATFASMWISNVAAPTLCYALIKVGWMSLQSGANHADGVSAYHGRAAPQVCLLKVPGCECLEPGVDRLLPASRSVPADTHSQIAIALASNIGGQASPISSPQNLIALLAMDPPLSWLEWFAVSLPVASISILAIWAFLHVNYRWEPDLMIPRMRKNTDSLSRTHYFVLFVSLVTIALWCVEKNLEWALGDMGIIAVIPLLAFFGTGILSKVSASTCFTVGCRTSL